MKIPIRDKNGKIIGEAEVAPDLTIVSSTITDPEASRRYFGVDDTEYSIGFEEKDDHEQRHHNS